MAAPNPTYAAKLERTQYKGWNVYKLSNDLATLIVAPDIGGRAIQLQLAGHDYFFVNKNSRGQSAA